LFQNKTIVLYGARQTGSMDFIYILFLSGNCQNTIVSWKKGEPWNKG